MVCTVFLLTGYESSVRVEPLFSSRRSADARIAPFWSGISTTPAWLSGLQIPLMFAVTLVAGVTVGALGQMDESSVPRITMAQFRELLATDGVLVIDVRDVGSFTAGHIPGAISIPLGTEETRIEELKRVSTPIVTYCA